MSTKPGTTAKSKAKSKIKEKSKQDSPELLEDKINELNKLVDKLEKGKISLDSAMGLYETGIKLARECQTQLSAAEQKVEVLTAENELIEFDLADSDDEYLDDDDD